MAKKNNTILLVGLLGIGGVAIYMWNKKKGQSTDTSPINSPSQTILPSPALSTAPVTQTQTNLPTSTSSNVSAVVQGWANADGRAPVLAMARANVPSEYAGMYDIITNYWNKGTAVGQSQIDFWDSLRNKYDPSHNVW